MTRSEFELFRQTLNENFDLYKDDKYLRTYFLIEFARHRMNTDISDWIEENHPEQQ